MDMTGEQRIAAPRETVWAALNDPEILRKCIPGCQQIEKHSATEMNAVAVIKVGPVSARFQGAVTLSDLDPPNGYRITGEGQGGVAGFARGTADVRLEADDDGTLLRYTVSAQIGGKLSQLGGRLIDATARKMSNAFFQRFAEEIQAGPVAETAPGQQPAASASSKPAGNASGTRPPPGATISGPGFVPAQPTSWDRWLSLAVLVVALVVMLWQFVIGASHAPMTAAPGQAVSAEFMIGVQLLVVLAIGFLLGRQQTARTLSAEQQSLLSLLMQRHRNDQS